MKIVLDAMGGDHAPQLVVDGAVQAAREWGTEIILVGQEGVVRAELAKHDTTGLSLSVVHASEVVTMEEHTMAVKGKKDSSLVVGMRLVKEGQADAFASAGNSGAVLAAAIFGLGRIRGIARPALASVYAAAPGPCLLLDIGANADCTPEYLLQFAIMGDAYARKLLGIERPRIGIVSNGEEEDKGSMLVRETYPLLKASDLNFVGNVEGKDIGRGLADVVVTDGMTGNVIIKLTEGLVSFLARFFKRQFTGGWLNKLALVLMIPGLIVALPGLVLMLPAVGELRRRMDWREFGGAPLLGVDGVVVIGHGRSDAKAIKNMIRAAQTAVQQDVVGTIKEELARRGMDRRGSAA